MPSGLRVTESTTSTDWRLATAMNLLQGDHTTSPLKSSRYAVAATGSHETGTPRTTLKKGLAYCLYVLHMIEVWGDRESAEWYMCGADKLMTSKNVNTK